MLGSGPFLPISGVMLLPYAIVLGGWIYSGWDSQGGLGLQSWVFVTALAHFVRLGTGRILFDIFYPLSGTGSRAHSQLQPPLLPSYVLALFFNWRFCLMAACAWRWCMAPFDIANGSG